jgi:hypothetical protein
VPSPQAIARIWKNPVKHETGLFTAFLAVLFAAGLAGCGAGGNALSSGKINLVFVVSEDSAYNASGDINPATANLTSQGLQRSLRMAKYLRDDVLGSSNVTGIYALEPMTHLETPNNYPDIVPLWSIQQFALLNHVMLSTVSDSYSSPYSAQSFPLNASYASGSVPGGVAAPSAFCSSCQGIDFNDEGGDNESLVNAIIKAGAPGYYVFSLPWETASAMMAAINKSNGYNLSLPSSYQGPNSVYAISIAPSGNKASLTTYDSGVQPASAYPALPASVQTSACSQQSPFTIKVTGGSGGARIPAGINTDETVYMIRHAESGGKGSWDDGNYIGAGQWRALDLPAALQGKISPSQVFSIDPGQFIGGTQDAAGNGNWSYVRAALTAEPYAVANNLPYDLAADFEIFSSDGPASASSFFFAGGRFSSQKILVAWEHTNISRTVNALIASYYPSGGAPVAPQWPSGDYDTIWTVTLDSQGNLAVNNATCEGIDSSALPSTPPEF